MLDSISARFTKADHMTTLEELNEHLTRPTQAEIDTLFHHPGDIVVLGASGKMGPSLVARIRRASPTSNVHAVARFTDPQVVEEITATGALPIVCDLHNPEEIVHLPEAPSVFYLVGRKFGSAQRPDLTWAANTLVPSFVGHHYRHSRIVVYSSGNVYSLVDFQSQGSTEESDTTPVGEYAQSALARERIFDYYAREHHTQTAILRLNYAVDCRYGTLVDIARRVATDQPVPIRVPKVNAIWQGDANRYAILALNHCCSPANILNITGPGIIDVIETARWFAKRLGKTVAFEQGTPRNRVLLNDASRCHDLFGPPEVNLATLKEWVAQWIESGGESLDKPTHFEATDGNF